MRYPAFKTSTQEKEKTMHPNRLLAAAFVASLLIATNLHAQVALDPYYSNTVSASVTYPSLALDPTDTVSSLPYTTPVTETEENESSTLTPAFTTGGFFSNFNQVANDADGSATGTTDLYFIPNVNVQYNLTGTASSTNPDGDTITAYLDDKSTNTLIYAESIAGNATLVLTSAGGPLTGEFYSTDLYEWTASATLDGPPAAAVVASDSLAPQAVAYTLIGAVDIAFTPIPEPATATLLLAAAAFQVARRRRPSLNRKPR